MADLILRSSRRGVTLLAVLTTFGLFAMPSLRLAGQGPQGPQGPQGAQAGTDRWESAIKKFEEGDKVNPPQPNAVVFIGASSIVRWNLPESFPELGPKAINRGFGGSLAADSTRYADRIVIPYKPRIVVFYAGDNDVEANHTPAQIAGDFTAFEQKVHAALPATEIIFISIKPSIRRWPWIEQIKGANALVRQYCATHAHLTFVDIVPQMIGADGKPRKELLVEDGLHMTPAGYKIWNDAIRPLLQPSRVSAQGGAGTIAGKVTGPNGAAVTGVSVVAKNTATQAEHKTNVSAQGEYTVAQLPAGTYDLSVPMIRGPFAEVDYQPFVQKSILLDAGQTLRVDIAMKLQGNLATLGDAPPAVLNGMRARAARPTGPAPRMPDGKPDLSGLWLNETEGEPAPPPALQPWAEAIRKERQEKQLPGPLSFCLPSSPIPIAGPFPYQLVQSDSMVVMLSDLDFPGWNQIFIDGRPHPKLWNPAWFGHATGSWQGDTLVVDIVGFNDVSFLQGAPHTEQLHVVERFRRPDAGHLEIDITAEDPGALSAVWKRHVSATLAGKDEQILEYLCENNVFPQHLVK